MRKNYFAKMVGYIKKVYDIEKNIDRLTDTRKGPLYTTGEVVLPVLLGFLLRVRSFNTLNNMIKENKFKKVLPKGMKMPKIDAIKRYVKSHRYKRIEKNINILYL